MCAYGTLRDSGFRQLIKTDADQAREAANLEQAFSDRYTDRCLAINKSGGHLIAGVDAYLLECEKHKAEVDSLNEIILTDIESVVGKLKFKRWKQLFTQKYLAEIELDTIVELHELTLTKEQWKKTVEDVTKTRISEHNSLFSFEAMQKFLVRNNHLTQEEFDNAAGDMFTRTISKLGGGRGPHFRPMSHMLYQDIPIRLVTSPVIQAELTMTVEQVQEATKLRKRLLEDMSTKKAESMLRLADSGGKQQARVEAEFSKWRERTKSELKELLSEEQFERLWQLYFQYNCRRMRLNWCCFIAGREFDVENRLGIELNELQTAARYQWQANQLLAGYKILQDLVGVQAARSMCGELKISPWMWSFDEPEKDLKLRRQIEREMFAGVNQGAPTNPRRNPQENSP